MLLKVNEIEVGYGNLMILRDFSLSMEAGELITVLGPNGAGKSTLISAIVGLLPLHRGTIEFQGQKIDGFPPHVISRLGISTCGQMKVLFGDMSVKDNLMLSAHARVRDPRKNLESLQKVFKLFPALKERISQKSRKPVSRMISRCLNVYWSSLANEYNRSSIPSGNSSRLSSVVSLRVGIANRRIVTLSGYKIGHT